MSLSLVDRHNGIYLREYCTYDKPSYDLICQYSFLGISKLSDLKNVYFCSRKNKLNKIFIKISNIKWVLKFSQEIEETIYLELDYGGAFMYASDSLLTYYKLSRGD